MMFNLCNSLKTTRSCDNYEFCKSKLLLTGVVRYNFPFNNYNEIIINV